MSKNNKQRKRLAAAKERNRTKGFKGPKSTTPKHTKKKAWFQLKDSNGLLLIFSNRNKKEEEKKAAKDKPNKGKKASNDEGMKKPVNKKPAKKAA